MHFFAVETDFPKLKQQFLGKDEEEVATIRYHRFLFYKVLLEQIAFTVAVFALSGVALYYNVPWWLIAALFLIWAVVFINQVLMGFIKCFCCFILLSTRKVVIVDQRLLNQKITTMNLENISNVISRTQFWGLFPLGILTFLLKQPSNAQLERSYILHPQECASRVTETCANFQPMVAPQVMTGSEDKPSGPQQSSHASYPSSGGGSDSGTSSADL